jgi:hypothetical protein
VRKLFVLAVIGGIAWWLFGSRRRAAGPSATIGYADGSSVTLEAGSSELDRLQRIAAQATAA